MDSLLARRARSRGFGIDWGIVEGVGLVGVGLACTMRSECCRRMML
jgi:hypothetical protein